MNLQPPPMRIILAIALSFCFTHSFAQVTGGHAMFEFLNVPTNAHLAGLGGNNVSVYDRDPNLFLANPALMNKKMDKLLSLNYTPYLAGIKSYQATFAYDLGKAGPIAISVKGFDYGKMEERTADDQLIGTFNARDYAITLGKSYTIGVITLGTNVKFLGSDMASYKANGWAIDMGALFKHPSQDFTIGMAVKNLGKVYKKYTAFSNDSLPFDVQLGSSYKFSHAPIRISLTGHHLHRWDIVYNDPSKSTKVDENGNPQPKKIKNLERLVSHLVLGLELIPVKFLSARIAYNYLMSKELSLTDGPSTAGLSFGGSIRWDRFDAGYTYTVVHKAGGMNVFTLNVDLGKGYLETN